MPTRGTRRPPVRAEELLALFGATIARRLIRHCDGRRIPSYRQYLSAVRRMLIVSDWQQCGFRMPELAAKYGISITHVKRIIYSHLRLRERMKDGA